MWHMYIKVDMYVTNVKHVRCVICAFLLSCAHQGKRNLLNVPVYHFPSHSFERGSFTRPRARLVAIKLQ